MIINIVGVSGSGKSYIASMLKSKNVVFGDGDELAHLGMKIAIQEDKLYTDNYARRLDRKHVMELVEKYREKKHIIFLGGQNVYNADYQFFIKIRSNEMEKTFRRRMHRELDKIINAEKVLRQEIDRQRIRNLHLGMIVQSNTLNQLRGSFKDFKQYYKGELDYYENDEFTTIATQAEIVKALEKITCIPVK